MKTKLFISFFLLLSPAICFAQNVTVTWGPEEKYADYYDPFIFEYVKGKNIQCTRGEHWLNYSMQSMSVESHQSLKSSMKELEKKDFHEYMHFLSAKNKLYFLLLKDDRVEKAGGAGIYLQQIGAGGLTGEPKKIGESSHRLDGKTSDDGMYWWTKEDRTGRYSTWVVLSPDSLKIAFVDIGEKNNCTIKAYDSNLEEVAKTEVQIPASMKECFAKDVIISNSGMVYFYFMTKPGPKKTSMPKTVLKVNPQDGALKELPFNIEGKQVTNFTFSTDENSQLMFCGLYGKPAAGKRHVEGIFYSKFSADETSVASQGTISMSKEDAATINVDEDIASGSLKIKDVVKDEKGNSVIIMEINGGGRYTTNAGIGGPGGGPVMSVPMDYNFNIIVFSASAPGPVNWYANIPKQWAVRNGPHDDFRPFSSFMWFATKERIYIIYNEVPSNLEPSKPLKLVSQWQNLYKSIAVGVEIDYSGKCTPRKTLFKNEDGVRLAPSAFTKISDTEAISVWFEPRSREIKLARFTFK